MTAVMVRALLFAGLFPALPVAALEPSTVQPDAPSAADFNDSNRKLEKSSDGKAAVVSAPKLSAAPQASATAVPSSPAAEEQHRQPSQDAISGTSYQRPAFPVEPGLSDPTRISESFRDALERRMPKQATPAGGSAGGPAPRTALPEISLVAKVCGHQKGMMHAMLRIDGKVELVRAGDKLTTLDKGVVTEIQVQDIQPDHVHILVKTATANEELILH